MAAKLETVAHDSIMSILGRMGESIGAISAVVEGNSATWEITADSETAAPAVFPGVVVSN